MLHPRTRLLPALALVLTSAVAAAQAPQTAGMRHTNYYTSQYDGSQQPYSIYVPSSYDPSGTHPVVVWLHPWGGRYTTRTYDDGTASSWADNHGWLLLDVDGRGNLNWDHYGETDVFEALDDLRLRGYELDEDRFYLYGYSMGGHGVYRLALRHPDRWAAAAGVAGWTDYRNFYTKWYEPWQSPVLADGYLDPVRRARLETASSLWQARNARHLDLRIAYGTLDSVNSPLNQERLVAALDGFGYSNYEEVALAQGHSINGSRAADVYPFFLDKVRPTDPRRISFTTNRLQYGDAWWVRVDALAVTGGWATVEGEIDGQQVALTTSGCAALSIDLNDQLLDMAQDVTVVIDGATAYAGPAQTSLHLAAVVEDGFVTGWAPVSAPPGAGQKRPDVEGPLAEVWRAPFQVVYGTQGDANQVEANRRDAMLFCAMYNGTLLYRWSERQAPPADRELDWWDLDNGYPWTSGSSMSVNDSRLIRPLADTDANIEPANRNLICFGGPATNALVADLVGRGTLPLILGETQVEVDGRLYSGPGTRYALCHPHPDHPERLVAICKGFLWSGYLPTDPVDPNNQFIGKDWEWMAWEYADYLVWDSTLPREYKTDAAGGFDSNYFYLPGVYLEAGTFNADWGLDTSAPAVRATVVDGIGGTGPDYVAPAHVTLDAADEMGGFGDDVIEYSLDGGPWTTYDAPLVLSTEGTYTISYRAGSANGQVLYGPHEGSGPIRAVDVLRETSATQQLTLRVVGSLPAVVSTSPVDGATRVPVDSSIVMEFSRPMDREATEQAFAINGVTPRFTWSDDGRTLLVTPYRLVRLPWPKVGDRHYLLPLLAAGTTYTVRLNGAVDATGLALPSYAFSFSTAAGDTGGSCGALPDGRGGPAAVLPWLGLLLLLRRRRRLNWRLARQPVADRPSRPGRRDR